MHNIVIWKRKMKNKLRTIGCLSHGKPGLCMFSINL